MDLTVIGRVTLIRPPHLILAHHSIWIRISVKVENLHMVPVKVCTSVQGKIIRKFQEPIPLGKLLVLVKAPDVMCKNLRKVGEWGIMDSGRFAFDKSTISIFSWVATCLYLAMRNIWQLACICGIFRDRYSLFY
jgi:hypothetical protein